MTARVEITVRRGGEDGNDLQYLFKANWLGVGYYHSAGILSGTDVAEYIELDVEGWNDALAEDIGWDTDE
jgi:hypothetical protein